MNHAWNELKELLDSGKTTYKYVPVQRIEGANAIERLKVNIRSYLGAVAYETEGIVLDQGWINLLGAGGDSIFGSLTSWNGLSDEPSIQPLDGLMVVAYDVAGGFFALDTGKYGGTGQVYYFAPDTLEWESTELAYSGFINWLAHGDLEQFYQTFRWKGWQDTMSELKLGEVIAYYPPLWTEEGNGERSSKAAVSVLEAWQAARRGN